MSPMPPNTKPGTDRSMVTTGSNLRGKLGLMTQDELAAILEVSKDTLADWRRQKLGPDFVRVGKLVLYREADIMEWVKRNTVPVVRSGPCG